jgi:CDGSH-type Zn-finger protein
MPVDPFAEHPSPVVTATENGPYEVKGVSRIVWREPVTTGEGEPIAWRTGEVVAEGEETYWLCRCGNSQNKPFCDSSHRRTGFTSDDPAPTAPRAGRAKAYPGDGVVVEDDRSLCTHAGFCANKISNVWKMTKDTSSTPTRSLVVAMVQRCPSGALTVRADDDPADLEPPLACEIALIPDGPLWVTGGIEVRKADGTVLETRNRMTLCRCGNSSTKPLCDGSHSDVGFSHSP